MGERWRAEKGTNLDSSVSSVSSVTNKFPVSSHRGSLANKSLLISHLASDHSQIYTLFHSFSLHQQGENWFQLWRPLGANLRWQLLQVQRKSDVSLAKVAVHDSWMSFSWLHWSNDSNDSNDSNANEGQSGWQAEGSSLTSRSIHIPKDGLCTEGLGLGVI